MRAFDARRDACSAGRWRFWCRRYRRPASACHRAPTTRPSRRRRTRSDHQDVQVLEPLFIASYSVDPCAAPTRATDSNACLLPKLRSILSQEFEEHKLSAWCDERMNRNCVKIRTVLSLNAPLRGVRDRARRIALLGAGTLCRSAHEEPVFARTAARRRDWRRGSTGTSSKCDSGTSSTRFGAALSHCGRVVRLLWTFEPAAMPEVHRRTDRDTAGIAPCRRPARAARRACTCASTARVKSLPERSPFIARRDEIREHDGERRRAPRATPRAARAARRTRVPHRRARDRRTTAVAPPRFAAVDGFHREFRVDSANPTASTAAATKKNPPARIPRAARRCAPAAIRGRACAAIASAGSAGRM